MAATARATINVAMSGNRRIRPTDPSPAWLGAIANGPRVPCDDIPGSITLPWRREASLPPPPWLAGSRAACAPRTVDETTLRQIGRASSRERESTDGENTGVADTVKKKKKIK